MYRFYGPVLEANMGPKCTFMLQDALKSPSGGVWEAFLWEPKKELNIEAI